jgi:hypothetical protein
MGDNKPSREVFVSPVQPIYATGSYFLDVPRMCLCIAHISSFIFSRGKRKSVAEKFAELWAGIRLRTLW